MQLRSFRLTLCIFSNPFFSAGGLVLSHVAMFPFRCSCRCKGAELLGIQGELVAVGHSIFQREEWIAQYSRCVPLLGVSRYPGLYSCGLLSIPRVCFRCLKAATEHLGACQDENLSVFTSVSLVRGEARSHPFDSLPYQVLRTEMKAMVKEKIIMERRGKETWGKKRKGDIRKGSSLENETFESLTWVLFRSRSLGLN